MKRSCVEFAIGASEGGGNEDLAIILPDDTRLTDQLEKMVRERSEIERATHLAELFGGNKAGFELFVVEE